MMKQIHKTAGLGFIGTIVLMILMHALIPHHHHFDSVFEHNQQTGQASQHSEDNPLHCHAFNELVTDKTVISVNNVSPVDDLSIVISDDDFRLRVTEIPVDAVIAINRDMNPAGEIFPENSPTRGSPASV